jgi:hypothetical protein
MHIHTAARRISSSAKYYCNNNFNEATVAVHDIAKLKRLDHCRTVKLCARQHGTKCMLHEGVARGTTARRIADTYNAISQHKPRTKQG